MDLELDFVSFEQAKALEELGFPQKTYDYLYLDGELISREEYYEMDCGGPFSVELSESECLSAPPLEFVAKWLRKEKDIILLPTPMVKWSESEEKYYGPHYESCYTNWNSPLLGTLKEKDKYGNFNPIEFATYEEALSAGIDNAIETLKNKKKGNEV